MILRYVSEWDSPETAEVFFRFYRQVLSQKWKKIDITGDTEDTLSGTGDDGCFVVRRRGALVTSLEGLASPEQAKASAMR